MGVVTVWVSFIKVRLYVASTRGVHARPLKRAAGVYSFKNKVKEERGSLGDTFRALLVQLLPRGGQISG